MKGEIVEGRDAAFGEAQGDRALGGSDGFSAAAGQVLFDAVNEGFGADGFGEVEVTVVGNASGFGTFQQCGDHDDGRLFQAGVGSDLFDQFDAVGSGHDHIEEHEIRLMPVNVVEDGGGVVLCDNFVTSRFLQVELHEFAEAFLVVDGEDAGFALAAGRAHAAGMGALTFAGDPTGEDDAGPDSLDDGAAEGGVEDLLVPEVVVALEIDLTEESPELFHLGVGRARRGRIAHG